MYGVFRVKNHDFTPTNHIFSNFRGAPPPPPLDPPLLVSYVERSAIDTGRTRTALYIYEI